MKKKSKELKEIKETNGRVYFIYFLEKTYKDCYIKSTNDAEKTIFFREMENLELIENKRLMNKYFIIFQLYKSNLEDMIYTLDDKEKEEFYKLLFYAWRVTYGLYDEKLDDEIKEIKVKKIYNYLLTKLLEMLIDLENQILSIPLTDDELEDSIKDFDHSKFFNLISEKQKNSMIL